MAHPFTMLAGTKLQRLQPPLACRWTRLVHEAPQQQQQPQQQPHHHHRNNNNSIIIIIIIILRSTTRRRLRRIHSSRDAPSTSRTRSPVSKYPSAEKIPEKMPPPHTLGRDHGGNSFIFF